MRKYSNMLLLFCSTSAFAVEVISFNNVPFDMSFKYFMYIFLTTTWGVISGIALRKKPNRAYNKEWYLREIIFGYTGGFLAFLYCLSMETSATAQALLYFLGACGGGKTINIIYDRVIVKDSKKDCDNE